MGRNLVAQDIRDFQSRLELLPIRSPRLPRPSHDLGYRLVMSRGNVSLSDFVSTSLYLLSNQLHDPRDGDKGLQLLCLLFEHDVYLFTEILLSEPATGKATWESLLRYSEAPGHHNNRSSRFILDVGIRCAWLNPCDTRVLVSALQMDCSTDIVAGIIDHLCRSGHSQQGKYILDAILIAYRKGRFDIAKSLVQRFDINTDSPSEALEPDESSGEPNSIFVSFMLGLKDDDEGRWNELDFFLSNGADVDRLMPSRWYTGWGSPSTAWYNKNEINRALRPRILDHFSYMQRSLFERLAQHSEVPHSALTRMGLEDSWEEGADAFRDYLKTRKPAMDLWNWENMRSPLKLFLNDEVRRSLNEDEPVCRDGADCAGGALGMSFKIVRSVIQCIVDLNRDPGSLINIHSLLRSVLRTLCNRSGEDGLQILNILMNTGADIIESHLAEAVGRNGIGILEWLQSRVKNFAAKAAGALATAARLNNFEAVEFLLQSGVNAGAFIDGAHMPRGFVARNINKTSLNEAYSVQATAAGGGIHSASGQSSLRMSQFLAERGAKLVVGPHDSTPFEFIAVLLKDCREDVELFEKVKFALSTLKQSKHRANPPAYLLEICARSNHFPRLKSFDEFKERMKIFEYLLDEGADVNPGSPLAALVRVGGPKELVERTLRLGANLNAFTAVCGQYTKQTPLQAAASQGNEDLVYLFLKQGANVNSRARGDRGMTALQAICWWDPATEQEHRRKMTICELLLSSGADINAAPARGYGNTALQAAVTRGDLELVTILVRDGAHVNAPPAIGGNYDDCALDAAARYGRLDIAKLLLDANALSENRGKTGYDGAIDNAESWGHHELASLIRGYHRNDMESSLNTPATREAAEGYRIHGNTTDGESTDSDYWPAKFYESSTDDDWFFTDDESSSERDAAEYGSNSGAASLMRRETNVPEDTETFPNSQVVRNTLPDDFPGYTGTVVDLTGDGVYMDCENEPFPDSSMGSLAETWDSRAFDDLQVVANASTNDRISHSGMGFVFPEEERQTQWENESMLQNSLETWAGMPDDSALWQRVFEEQNLEFGFPTFDNTEGPEMERRDAELQTV